MVSGPCACFGGTSLVEATSPRAAQDVRSQSLHDGEPSSPTVGGAAAQPGSFLESGGHSFASGSYMHRFSATQGASPAISGGGSRAIPSGRASSMPAAVSARASVTSMTTDVSDHRELRDEEGSWLSRSFMRSARGVEAVVAKIRRRRAAEDGTGNSAQIDRQSTVNSRNDDLLCTRTSIHDRDRDTALVYSGLSPTHSLPSPTPVPFTPRNAMPITPLSPITSGRQATPLFAQQHNSVPETPPVSPEPQPPRGWRGLLCCNMPAAPPHADSSRRRRSTGDSASMALTCSEMRALAETMLASAATAQEAAVSAATAAQAVEAQYRQLLAACASASAARVSSGPSQAGSTAEANSVDSPGLRYQLHSRHSMPELSTLAHLVPPPGLLHTRSVAGAQDWGSHGVSAAIGSRGALQQPVSPTSPSHVPVSPSQAIHQAAQLSRGGLAKRTSSASKLNMYRGLAIRLNKMAHGSGPERLMRHNHDVIPEDGASPASVASVATPTRHGLRYTIGASSRLPADSSTQVSSMPAAAPPAAPALPPAAVAPPSPLCFHDYSSLGRRRVMDDPDDWDASSLGVLSSHADDHEEASGASNKLRLATIGSVDLTTITAVLTHSHQDIALPDLHPSAASHPTSHDSTQQQSQQASEVESHATAAVEVAVASPAPRLTASVLSQLNRGFDKALFPADFSTLIADTDLVAAAAATGAPASNMAQAPTSGVTMLSISVSASGVPPGPALVIPLGAGSSFTHNRSRFCDPGARGIADGGAGSPLAATVAGVWDGCGAAPPLLCSPKGGLHSAIRRGSATDFTARAMQSRQSDSGSLPCSLVRSDTAGSDGLAAFDDLPAAVEA